MIDAARPVFFDSHSVSNLQNTAVHNIKFKHTPETINTRKLDPREGMIDSDIWSVVH